MKTDNSVGSKLRVIKNKLDNASVCWVVFAGAAAHCYGSKRKVTDIDILVKDADLEKVNAILNDIEGFDVVADLEINTKQGRCRFFMDDEMIDRVRWKRLLGVTVPIIPLEDNIIFKATLQRGKEQGKHDIEDIQRMATNEKIDLEYLKKRIKKCHAEKRVKALLESLGIL